MTDPAKKRWVFLNVLRIGGLIIMAVGLLIWRKGIGGFQDELIGKILFVLGIFEALVLPAALRRSWRSKDMDSK